MSLSIQELAKQAEQTLSGMGATVTVAMDEVTVEIPLDNIIDACLLLRDEDELSFEQLIDLCGVDYSEYGDVAWQGARYAVVYHLLSIKHNQRIRIRTFVDDEFPVIPSVIDVWSAANWFEREAFDLYGILFEGHPDLRRILTDYGFVGHPFRKDFPLSGNVEMRYDEEKKRVIYQPVTIEARINVPRVIRDDHRYETAESGE
ncbi:MAG: NADH-quinone oxidoreductase subunit C [Gammaproteobacteria bacterium]|nr:NADH-quinone oxidoreductase subunit C [Gammaproteobacteria bacterium]